ncbi:ubiquitin carboxyl-terminal hydrolase 2 [Ophiostoma piceae UAMH 11346]|uniref:Ubiquitin carboxyl-terminal hydrolase n=1 Tax=Ophiostoma piceae (strain UAMH 11346) TaxID=1262450 RepID=S3CCJ0_OPHP1|nr:ubiquitin carboxyl-terminal hydrolase 2 [Ophiostoma piceae UAMH 11346]
MSGGWNTIESDAGVFTYLLDKLGVEGVQFEELLSLDVQTLAELNPVYGIIFLFKFPTNAPYVGDGGVPRDGKFDHDAAERIFFAHQTIQNACGTQALLSVILNKALGPDGETPEGAPVKVGGHLGTFLEFAMNLPPDLRGEALSNDELIREVHNSFAKSSPFVDETQRPSDPSDADDVFHFIAYTATKGHLYELDGLQPAPIDHGPCDENNAVEFAERAIAAVQRRIARYGADEIHFNLMAAVRDRRLAARELGDAELLAAEARKRRDWQFENALRRHNFVGFSHEVLEGVVENKLREGADDAADPEKAYKKWVGTATERYEKRLGDRYRRRHGGGDTEMQD